MISKLTICRALWKGLVSAILFASWSGHASTLRYDFDSGSPTLIPTMSLPLNQTVGGVTAGFAGRFSIQSDSTTFFGLSGISSFSGNYLYPNDVFSPSLTVSFDSPLTALGFDFVTADFGLETNTNLRLTAYLDSTSNLVGSATAHGIGEASWSVGHMDFNAGGSLFNLVTIVILPGAGSDFLGDNFIVTTAEAPAVPEPGTYAMLLTGLGLLGLATRRRKLKGVAA